MLVLRRWYDFVLVSDAHYAGVRPMGGQRLLQKLLDFHNSKTDLVIVTNSSHALYLASKGCRAFICADPLPRFMGSEPLTRSLPPKSVFLVCSFDRDEPYETAFEAFRRLQGSGYSLLVSGNFAKAKIKPHKFPWVRFLGFVPEEEYYSTLRSCSVVMDLTTHDDCLVCGAYEAFAAGKPVILSDTPALREHFGGAAVLTANTPEAIARSVERAHMQRDVLALKVVDWNAMYEVQTAQRIAGLKQELSALHRSAAHN